MNKLEHDLKYIYWDNESRCVVLTNEEFAEKMKFYMSKGTLVKNKTVRLSYIKNKNPYFLKRLNTNIYLYTREKGEYVVYTTNTFDPNKNIQGNVGTKAIQALARKFKERTSLSLITAFGSTEDNIKDCVPKQFVYINDNYCNINLSDVSSVDGSSWYPAHMMGLLPTSKGSITVKGTVKPNKDYPFAFYIVSGHCAQYNEFDTHDWVNHKLFKYLFRDTDYVKAKETNLEDDITILMKASDYNFKEEYEYFYSLRKTDEEAKLVMNASIGMMHTKKYTHYRYAHLVAIAIARANNDHLKLIDEIGLENIIQICVDGIMYFGDKKYGIDEKHIGVYNQEYLSCNARIREINAYIVEKNDIIIKVKHGAYNANIDGTDIDESKINKLEDVNNWINKNPIKELIYG